MKTGIVFEGGAFRTIFSCGVMDAFLEKDIMPDYMIGVSAGAAYAPSYAARQKGRNLKILLDYRDDKRYMGVGNMINRKNKSIYGLEFSYATIPNELEPFDYDAFDAYHGELYAVVTNVLTGKAEYMRYTTEDKKNTLLQASCALPALFPFIYIDGTPYLDGGLSDSIPFERAFADGCDRVVVVLTREAGYKKKTTALTKTMARAYLKYPELAKDLVKRAGRYNRSLRKLEKLEKSGKVIVIRPESTKGFSRLERDKNKIMNLYDDGYSKGIAIAGKVKQFYTS
jgi:predicted patatin/cPLA2 family phospholipase